MTDVTIYDAARERLERESWSPEVQSALSMLLLTAKQGNAVFQTATLWLPLPPLAGQFLHSQAYRETEALTLLLRVTEWSSQAQLYWESAQRLLPLTTAWSSILCSGAPLGNAGAYFHGLALGHAALSQVRLLPILPKNTDPSHPYAMALVRIEQENNRLLQTQNRLLKHLGTELPGNTRESIIDDAQSQVKQIFTDYMSWFASNTPKERQK